MTASTAISYAAASPAASRYLGPARVLRVWPAELEVELCSGSVRRATLALAIPYRPLRGDEVLVIGEGDRHYVIGVLAGRGSIRLKGRRLTLRALGGSLRLSARRGIQIRSPRLDWLAQRQLHFEHAVAIERLVRLRQHVAEKLSIVTRDLDQLIERRWFTQAGRVCLKVADAFYFNGKTVRMG